MPLRAFVVSYSSEAGFLAAGLPLSCKQCCVCVCVCVFCVSCVSCEFMHVAEGEPGMSVHAHVHVYTCMCVCLHVHKNVYSL